MSENKTKFLQNEVWWAVRDGQTNRLKALLNDVDKDVVCEVLSHYTNEDGQSTPPLIIAAMKGNEEAVTTLVDYGIDLELKGTVVYEKEVHHGATALWCASCWGQYTIVRILIENGADVDNSTDSGSTPLKPACHDGRFEIVQYLVEHGADINTTNIFKATCLMTACNSGHYDITHYLLTKEANPELKNVDGKTALHVSAAKGHLAISKLLVAKKVPVMVKDNFGVTPLMEAAVNGNTDVVDYLSTLAECSREDRIDAMELLGTSFLFLEDPDILEAHRHLMTAMQERYKYQNEIIPKRVPHMSSIQAITGKKECETLSELIDLRHDELSLCIEALNICERVLGAENREVTYPLFHTGAMFADNCDYNKCIDIWLYASKIYQNIDKDFDVDIFFVLFAEMLHGGIQIDFSSLLNYFQSAETELRLDKGRMKLNEGKYRQRYEMDIISCTYLIGIMLLSYSSNGEECQLNRVVYNFIQQKNRFQNGFTPLHICCDGDSNDNDIDVEGELLFPSVLICKVFVACGANVNAQDKNRNTPLHIIAKCVDAELDTISEIIMCLIDNGAHVDACNIDGNTAAEVASTDIAESIIKANMKLSLKCLSARTVRKHKIEYQGIIPESLHEFVELH